MTTLDPLLKAREVAEMLSISIPSLYRRMADGTIPPPIKLGSLSRWSRSEILHAVDDARLRRTRQAKR
jgi:predicted DNA-binding transcriptional regulator AlpA